MGQRLVDPKTNCSLQPAMSQRETRSSRYAVIKLPFLSFFPLFFLPFRYNTPFLCPHVTCQLSRVRLYQALSSLNLSGSSSLTPTHNRPNNCQALSGSVQPHSRPLAFLSQTPFMPLSLKKHVTLLRYQPSTFSCLMQLSHRTAHSAYCPYCPS